MWKTSLKAWHLGSYTKEEAQAEVVACGLGSTVLQSRKASWKPHLASRSLRPQISPFDLGCNFLDPTFSKARHPHGLGLLFLQTSESHGDGVAFGAH